MDVLNEKLSYYIGKLEDYSLKLCDYHKQNSQDLLQDLAIKVFSNRKRFENIPDIEIAKYLNTALKNTFIDNIRKTKRQGQLHQLMFVEDVERDEFIASRLSISQIPYCENEAYSRIFKKNLDSFIKKNLSTKQAETFQLTCIDDYKIRVVAESMGTNVNTISARIRGARKKLKQFVLQ
jgi:RNA polymerase sigma factor (sigma-70 family)